MNKSSHTTVPEFFHIGFIIAAMCILGAVFPVVLNSTYKGSPDIHATLEMAGSLVGVLAGIVLVVHFYVLGSRFYLLVGLAYFINGAEDFVHGLISFRNLFNLPPEQLKLAIPATYVTGRILMGLFLIAAPFVTTWFGESTHSKRETVQVSFSAIVVSIILTWWAFYLSLPETIRPEMFIPRPLDFLSAIILGVALVAFLRMYHRDRNQLTWWITLSICVNVVGQLIMSFSRSIYDPFFDIAHLYKVFGYMIPVLGFSLHQIENITRTMKAVDELNGLNCQMRASIDNEKTLSQQLLASIENEKARAEDARADDVRRDWFKSGQNELNSILWGDKSSTELADRVLAFFIGYIDASVGVFYLYDDTDESLEIISTYAVSGRKRLHERLALGEGVPGQVAKTRRMVHINPVPPDYLPVSSALGEAAPLNIIVQPVMNNNRLEAVLELGSFRLFTPDALEFLQQSMKGIAITLGDIHSRQLVSNLLEQAQAQSEELRVLQGRNNDFHI